MNYYCHYCDQRCKKQQPSSDFWYCKPCLVFFKEDGSEICFRPNTPEHLIWFHIFFKENKTVISRERNPASFTKEEKEEMMDYDLSYQGPPTILTVPYAVQGATPQNIRNKLKTLLVFS